MVYVDGLVVAQADRQQPGRQGRALGPSTSRGLPRYSWGHSPTMAVSLRCTTSCPEVEDCCGLCAPGAIDELVFSNRTSRRQRNPGVEWSEGLRPRLFGRQRNKAASKTTDQAPICRRSRPCGWSVSGPIGLQAHGTEIKAKQLLLSAPPRSPSIVLGGRSGHHQSGEDVVGSTAPRGVVDRASPAIGKQDTRGLSVMQFSAWWM